MNGRWIGGRLYIGHDGVDYFFEPCGSYRVRLFAAVDIETNERIPIDTIDLSEPEDADEEDEYKVIRDLIEANGQRLDTRTESKSLAEAM